MSDRKYSEEEVAQIIATATEAQQGAQPRFGAAQSSGLTLSELQEIGREVGIAPDLITKAAKSIDQRVESSSSRFLGLPIAVAETAYLNRTVSDAEWERLVSDMRMTFNATGRTRTDGAFKQWSNGNLRAMLEPTENGHRVRIQTMKGNARVLLTGGLALLGLAAALFVATRMFPNGPKPWAIVQLGIMGTLGLAAGALQIPSWARRRREQMQGLIGRLMAGA